MRRSIADKLQRIHRLLPPRYLVPFVLFLCTLSSVQCFGEAPTGEYSTTLGRGQLSRRLLDGTELSVRFSDGYYGYVGGLAVGSIGRPGIEQTSDKNPLGLWYRQRESIVDHHSGKELNFNRSENHSTAETLHYCGGRELNRTDKLLDLVSSNANAGYLILKTARWEQHATYLLIGAAIYNYSNESKSFDYWVGNDAGIDERGAAARHIGWAGTRLIKQETKILDSSFRSGGFVDFSYKPALAGIFEISSHAKQPTEASFSGELADSSKGSSSRMRALNVGWKNIELKPGQLFEIAYAIGATSVRAGNPISKLPIRDRTWRELSENLKRAADEIPCARTLMQANASVISEPRFFREYLDIELVGHELKVKGQYFFLNPGAQPRSLRILYPFPHDRNAQMPNSILFNSKPVKSDAEGFPLELKIGNSVEAKFEIEYRQLFNGTDPRYIVSSTRSWPQPLAYASFLLRESLSGPPSRPSFPFLPLRPSQSMRYSIFATEHFYPKDDLTFQIER